MRRALIANCALSSAINFQLLCASNDLQSAVMVTLTLHLLQCVLSCLLLQAKVDDGEADDEDEEERKKRKKRFRLEVHSKQLFLDSSEDVRTCVHA